MRAIGQKQLEKEDEQQRRLLQKGQEQMRSIAESTKCKNKKEKELDVGLQRKERRNESREI